MTYSFSNDTNKEKDLIARTTIISNLTDSEVDMTNKNGKNNKPVIFRSPVDLFAKIHKSLLKEPNKDKNTVLKKSSAKHLNPKKLNINRYVKSLEAHLKHIPNKIKNPATSAKANKLENQFNNILKEKNIKTDSNKNLKAKPRPKA